MIRNQALLETCHQLIIAEAIESRRPCVRSYKQGLI